MTLSKCFAILAVPALLLSSLVHAEQSGAELFQSTCAKCHGANGSGKTTAGTKMGVPDLRSKAIQDMSNDDLYDTIAKGVKHKNYPHAFLYTGHSERQIRSVVDYIRTLK